MARREPPPPEEAPTYDLRPLSPDAVAAALDKVERYRLLNEPWEAESICLDVLAVEPDNQQALISLLLALTDQFATALGENVARATALLSRLRGEYERAYYAGIIAERRAKALLHQGTPGSGAIVYEWLHQAMRHYEEAETLRPAGNQSALLRWNTCARLIMRYEHVRAQPEERIEPMLE